jgi:hypothetical protein
MPRRSPGCAGQLTAAYPPAAIHNRHSWLGTSWARLLSREAQVQGSDWDLGEGSESAAASEQVTGFRELGRRAVR